MARLKTYLMSITPRVSCRNIEKEAPSASAVFHIDSSAMSSTVVKEAAEFIKPKVEEAAAAPRSPRPRPPVGDDEMGRLKKYLMSSTPRMTVAAGTLKAKASAASSSARSDAASAVAAAMPAAAAASSTSSTSSPPSSPSSPYSSSALESTLLRYGLPFPPRQDEYLSAPAGMGPKVDELLLAVSGSDRGVAMTDAQRAKVAALVAELEGSWRATTPSRAGVPRLPVPAARSCTWARRPQARPTPRQLGALGGCLPDHGALPHVLRVEQGDGDGETETETETEGRRRRRRTCGEPDVFSSAAAAGLRGAAGERRARGRRGVVSANYNRTLSANTVKAFGSAHRPPPPQPQLEEASSRSSGSSSSSLRSRPRCGSPWARRSRPRQQEEVTTEGPLKGACDANAGGWRALLPVILRARL